MFSLLSHYERMIQLNVCSSLRLPSTSRSRRLRVPVASERNEKRGHSNKTPYSAREKRRRGRPAHLRSPSDSPLRDGNRDRLIGLLTKRSAVTLCYYLMETNINLHHWLVGFIKQNPIPERGSWEDVSGDTFLRNLLSMKQVPTKWSEARDPIFDCVVESVVDPRNIAQRIMTIRRELAREFIQELENITEENNLLYRETLSQSLLMSSEDED